MNKERYIVKPEDLKGDIEGFPIEIVQWMVDEQVRQWNKADVAVFQGGKCSTAKEGGIDWYRTSMGLEGCEKVIEEREFELFLGMHPKIGDVPFVKPENTGTPLPTMPESIWYGPHIPHTGQIFTESIPLPDPEKEKYRHRLYETAKAAMHGLLANNNPDLIQYTEEQTARCAIAHAKELLRQLGEEETKNKE